MEAFQPLHVRRSASIRLNAPRERVFPLFEPVGERSWAAGWAPVFLHPEGGEAREGATFLTRAEDEPETIWTVMVHEPAAGRVVYARITPGVRAGRVEVRCEPAGGETVAHVSYHFTALSPRGNDVVGALTEDAYRGWMREWETSINRFLATGVPANAH
jgi:Polyketide cyclase / dehydrase and lipid transport